MTETFASIVALKFKSYFCHQSEERVTFSRVIAFQDRNFIFVFFIKNLTNAL